MEDRKTQRKSVSKIPTGSETSDCGSKQSHFDRKPASSCNKPRACSFTNQNAAAKTHQGATGGVDLSGSLFSPAVFRRMVWCGRQGERKFFVGHRVRLGCCRMEGVFSCQHVDVGSKRKAFWHGTSPS